MAETPRPIVPVILCGGNGQRLWPVSRAENPKQFHALLGDTSPFQDTLARVCGPEFSNPIVVAGNDHRFLVAEQLRASGAEATIVLEPMRRDSCAAIAAACEIARRVDEDALLLVLSADHAIPDVERFLHFVHIGVRSAERGMIVTFGITPTQPATGYGYILPDASLEHAESTSAIAAFVEKPDRATAEGYLEQGYLWNSGIFMFRARDFLSEIDALAPDIAAPVRAAVENARTDLDFLRLDPEHFALARATSIDYAVMEKTARAAVVRTDFAWSDIGSWEAVRDMAAPGSDGNRRVGRAVFVESTDCFVHSPEVLTTVLAWTTSS